MLRAIAQDMLGSIAGLAILTLCERFPLAAVRAQKCVKVAVFDWDQFELRSIDGALIAELKYSLSHDVPHMVILSSGEHWAVGDFVLAYGYLMDWAFRNGYKVIRSGEV